MKPTMSNLKNALHRYNVMLYTCKKTDPHLKRQIENEIYLIKSEINALLEQKKRRK